MRMELTVLGFFAALVPQVFGQLDPSILLAMINPDIKLPPKPPRSLFPQYYRSPQDILTLRKQHRRRQELQLFQRLRAMTPAQIKTLQERLTPTQLQHLVNRLKYLKHQVVHQRMHQQTQSGTSGSQAGSNMILSGANKIRRPVNAVQGSSFTRRPTSRPTSQSRRPPSSPFEAIRRYQTYRKKAMSALGAGCTYPVGGESMLDSFMLFSQGGCATGAAVCMMSGQSCVDVGTSIMCCPPGYSSSTLDAFGYMKQMQAFMSQFQ